MNFRIRGNNVHLVKSVVDPASGRAKSSPVGSMNLITGRLSDYAKQALTAEEVALVEGWLTNKQGLDKRKRQLEAEMLPTTMSNVIQWINEADKSEVERMASEIQFALGDVRQAIVMKLKA